MTAAHIPDTKKVFILSAGRNIIEEGRNCFAFLYYQTSYYFFVWNLRLHLSLLPLWHRFGKDLNMQLHHAIPVENGILKGKKRLHFIGIGGSGMFPIVQILHKKGYIITGSDNNESDILKMERGMGIQVSLGHKAENAAGADLVVYSAAIFKDNCELLYAKEHGIPTAERSVMLGAISDSFDNAICVSGTHGKTTATSLLTSILIDCGRDPSAVIGGKLPKIGGYGCVGEEDLFVCEACEFVDTFLHLSPDIAVILNIDGDHLDYFKTMENLKASFHRFASMASRLVIYNGDDQNTRDAMAGVQTPSLTFGLSPENDYSAADITLHDGVNFQYTLLYHGNPQGTIVLSIPGRHNVLNSLAAIAAAHEMGIPFEQIAKCTGNFHGAGRRFEILDRVDGVTFADDYAHHPTELRATLETAKQMDFQRVWAVFQPFTYSRTAMLLEDFAQALSIADRVVLSEIMGSREKNTYHIYSADLAAKIDGCIWFSTFEEIADYMTRQAQPGDLVITLGCGDVYKCARMMIAKRKALAQS